MLDMTMMKQPARPRLAGRLLAALFLLVATAANASPSNKWRLEFSGGADSDGEIVIRITPKGGESIETITHIEDGRSENGVAKDVVKALEKQLPKEAFKVERDDGEDVLIKKRRGAAIFDVEILSITIKGVRINPDKE
jgi:hypothetical protein